ncbi:hypothetical protein [Desulfosporosinus sp. Sb-LF]|uniref:hypothetical protein n=1 Tax=Desulfosporosinus sp. Sb-LF TaxID=2560027 RepID=UPI00107F976D|nr:hypothetical protein [Desulfosporosinus sp. Sb-LF]TGE32445.1 hypothetical protein E4K68_12690 [Desulfosporosinus sp. Sb-LF]
MIGENWSFLCGVSQDLEADIIIGLLKQEAIPAIKQYPEAGGFLKIAYGLTTGVDLYVPKESRHTALQLIEESVEIPFDNEEGHEKEVESMHNALVSTSFRTSHSLFWTIVCVVLVLVTFVYYYYLL